MLPLDHIPFYDLDPDALAEAFRRLGFTISPPSRYTAPDFPDARWDGRCVFLQHGWFDLLQDDNPGAPGAPMSVLFRTPDLAASCAELAVLNPQAPVRLERRWAGDDGAPPQQLVYATLRSRIAPFPLAIIEHPWPCEDVPARWQVHANGAEAVTGLIFGGEAPGPAAATAARALDPGALEYWPLAEFQAAIPATTSRRAVRVRVADLGRTRRVLEAGGVMFEAREHALVAPAQLGLAAGFIFSEDGSLGLSTS